MTRKRSLHAADSMLSCTSSESSLSGTFVESLVGGAHEGWMYWKRDQECWMKVYVVLRKQFLWLTRSCSQSSLASPLIQMAVARVEQTPPRGFVVTGPSGETMELSLYQVDHKDSWYETLVDAATLTQLSLQELALKPERPSHYLLTPRSQTDRNVYRGTLVVYEEERKGSRWRRFWESLRLRHAIRKRLEEVVDRLDAPSHNK